MAVFSVLLHISPTGAGKFSVEKKQLWNFVNREWWRWELWARLFQLARRVVERRLRLSAVYTFYSRCVE